ncbi:CBS domain-containing protein [Halalkalicoccus subterraneus]|uniref:CBS domain-containing protein n=1 Tax=Halalkalicoccus subterraneus TaxID=2675002 RepID=UPI000EFAB462|nr:CBS domain-containing protein [Halalkalicoccus subterraneus]
MVEDLIVKEAMTTAYVGVSESDTVGDVIDVMIGDGVSGVVVLRGKNAVGTVTERDLLRAVTAGSISDDTGIASVMSGPDPSVKADVPLSEAASTLSTGDKHQLLVRNGEGLVGVLTPQDVLTAAASSLSSPEREIETMGRSEEPEEEDGQYSTQSVCEVCGSLMPGLESVNGQAVCADCRGV